MATTIDWAAAVDGDFANGDDWVGGAEPTKRDIANLDSFQGSPYTVTFDTSPEGKNGRKPAKITGLQVGSGVTLDILDALDIGYPTKEGSRGGQFTNNGTVNIAAAGPVEVFGTVTNSGLITLDNGSTIGLMDSAAKFVNYGQITLLDGYISRLAIDEGFINAGLVEGTGVIFDSILNTGTISADMPSSEVAGLVLDYDVTNNGLLEAINNGDLIADRSITGSGHVDIDGGAFEIVQSGGGTFGQNVEFGPSPSSLFELGSSYSGPESFTGTISGFAKNGNSAIELGDMIGAGSAEVSYSGTKKGGILTITGDGQIDTIAFAGNYLGVTFSANMTATGTTVTASKSGGSPLPSVAPMVQALATFASPAAHMTSPGDHSPTDQTAVALVSNHQPAGLSVVCHQR